MACWPQTPGAAGTGTASGASPRPGASSGLTLTNRDSSSDPAPRAAGVGCVRGFAGPMAAGWRPGIPAACAEEGRVSAALSKLNCLAPPSETGTHASRAVEGRVRGAMGRKMDFRKSYPRPAWLGLAGSPRHMAGCGRTRLPTGPSAPLRPLHRLQFRRCTHHPKTSLSTAQHAQPVGSVVGCSGRLKDNLYMRQPLGVELDIQVQTSNNR